MNFPDTRDITLIAGVSPVPSLTVNKVQDEEVRLWRALRRGDLILFDHFTGDTLDRSIWQNPTTPGNVALVDDSANRARGALAISGTGSQMETQFLSLASSSWQFYVSARIPNYAAWTAGKSSSMGLVDGSLSTMAFSIVKGATSDHWTAVVGAVVTDLGVGVADTNYHDYEIRFDGTTLSFLIDSVVKYSVASTATGARAVLLNQIGNGVANNLFVDKFALWVSDYPTAGGSAVAGATGGHIEQGVVTFDGTTDFIDVVFNIDFADTNYQFKYGVLLAAATDANIIINLAATPSVALTHGLRIKPTSRPPANMKVSWEVSR